MRCEILEGPLDILVRSQLPRERGGLLTAEAQDAVVGWQHPAVKEHHILIVMVCEDVIEGNVLRHHGILYNKAYVLRAVDTHVIPKRQQSLFVVVGGYSWLRKFRLEKVP